MIYVRPLELRDIHEVTELIKGNWSDEQIVKTAVDQMYEAKCSNGNTDIARYFVAYDYDSMKILGCAGYRKSWLAPHTYELVWINVKKSAQRNGIGSLLTAFRIGEIKKEGGKLILLMTHKPDFFTKWFSLVGLAHDGWYLMKKQL